MILLATYNAGDMLNPQLESLTRQTHKDWSLLVSDDGSSDDTLKIIRSFAHRHPAKRITLIRGPGRGSAQNFLSLLRAAGDAPNIAFCDQDDVWFEDKLSRALDRLRTVETPAIYGSSTLITDENLAPLRTSIRFHRPTGFKNALVQNVAGGNTMVMNRAALDVLQPTSLRATRITAHDWWSYQMVTGIGGQMIYDATPGLYYRQHRSNQIGANDTLKAKISRLRRLACGGFALDLNAHLDALLEVQECFTPAARRAILRCYGFRSKRLQERLQSLLTSGVYRQSFLGSVAFNLAALAGRL